MLRFLFVPACVHQCACFSVYHQSLPTSSTSGQSRRQEIASCTSFLMSRRRQHRLYRNQGMALQWFATCSHLINRLQYFAAVVTDPLYKGPTVRCALCTREMQLWLFKPDGQQCSERVSQLEQMVPSSTQADPWLQGLLSLAVIVKLQLKGNNCL